MSKTFVLDISNALLNGMGTNLFAKSTQLIAGIAPLFMSAFSIYVMLIFIDSYRNGLEENFLHLSKKFLGWIIIIACAFNATEYQKIANFLYTLPDQLAGLFSSGHYTASAMDTAFNNFKTAVGHIFEYQTHIGITNVGDKITIGVLGSLITCLGFIFFAMIFGMYLVVKLSLAMVILTGPIFIGAMLFPATRQWGMNWIGQILNYTVATTFYVILGMLQLDFFKNTMLTILNSGLGVFNISMISDFAGEFLFSTIIFAIVALSIPHIASALTGGASISGHMHTLMRLAKLKMGGGGGKGGGGMKKD